MLLESGGATFDPVTPLPNYLGKLAYCIFVQVFCNVVVLRSHGSWMSRGHILSQPLRAGVLDYRKAPDRFGKAMQARLLAIKDLERDVLPQLQYARVLTIKEGGVLVDGFEISTRGLKSKAIKTRQTWWCITEQDVGLAALERMDPRSSSGFHVNDDDQ